MPGLQSCKNNSSLLNIPYTNKMSTKCCSLWNRIGFVWVHYRSHARLHCIIQVQIYLLWCLIWGVTCIHKCNEEITSILKMKIIVIIVLLAHVLGKRQQAFQRKYCQMGMFHSSLDRQWQGWWDTCAWFPRNFNGLWVCPVTCNKGAYPNHHHQCLKKNIKCIIEILH